MPTLKKLHLADMIQFAIQHIPQVDRSTLILLQDLVFTQGNYGEITPTELVVKMQQLAHYVPTVDLPSLLILAELLELPIPPTPPQPTIPNSIQTVTRFDQAITLAA